MCCDMRVVNESIGRTWCAEGVGVLCQLYQQQLGEGLCCQVWLIVLQVLGYTMAGTGRFVAAGRERRKTGTMTMCNCVVS